jgi:CDP-paratose 2-epimerase
MSVVVITGVAGLIGSEAARHFGSQGMHVVGIDNDMRKQLFGDEATVRPNLARLTTELQSFDYHDVDIRNREEVDRIFDRYGASISLVIHTAAQPSHDWAARDPFTDFTINANGTLTMLESTRHHAPDAVFIFTSTNKVYGDRPNELPLIELDTRWEIDSSHEYVNGIPESMSIDHTLHSLFGASKVSADVLVQEYGRYFGMRTVCFRGGCLTGPNHSGTELHGFLSYLMKCTLTGTPYSVYGYKGKQVRDNIHSSDLINAFDAFYRAPRIGEVYNIGGGRHSNCSMLEAIEISQEIAGRQLLWSYQETNRIGDHIWWISDTSRFQAHYPDWKFEYDVPAILAEIAMAGSERWVGAEVLVK